jgi:simple sugar transport system ATP-binding protein
VQKSPSRPGAVVLELVGLHARDDRDLPALRGVDLRVRAGEIVGVAGVEGNGQSELVEALIGLRAVTAGHIMLEGREVTGLGTRPRREAGLSAIPEDRLKHGVAVAASIRDNLAMSRYYLPPLARGLFLAPARMAKYARSLVKRNDIRTGDIDLPVASLSGGNMQKLVVARELGLEPCLLIAAQPTRGVDIGAIQAIHEQIVAARDRGAAVLVVSAELSEILALADRIAVFYEGQVTGLFEAGTVSEEELGLYMLGVKRMSEPAA